METGADVGKNSFPGLPAVHSGAGEKVGEAVVGTVRAFGWLNDVFFTAVHHANSYDTSGHWTRLDATF
eukprot:gene22195-biopygen8725